MGSRGKRLVELCFSKNQLEDLSDSNEEPFSPSGSEYLPSEDSRDSDNNETFSPSASTFNLVDPPNTESYANDDLVSEREHRPKRGKKRKYATQNRVLRKKFCNENKPYVTARGKEVESKIFNPDYQCGCRKKFCEMVSREARERFFNQFWTIGSFSGRCAFLNAHVKESKKKRTYTKKALSKRNKTRRYEIDGQEICKIAFLKTLEITQNRVDVALQKRKDPIITDNRGTKSGGRNKCSPNKVQEVINHINSFPRYVSHYCRKETTSKFLSPELNLAKMYDLYKDYSKEAKPVSLSSYKAIFYKNFNLRFKSPKKDTCLACDTFKNQLLSLAGEKRERLKLEHDAHIQKAKVLRDTMNKDLAEARTNETLETLTFDLQKTHSLPRIPTGVVYYKRQLNFYNLGIHVGSSGKGIFNVWTENVAGRGTQEVGSCLKKYIEEHVEAPVKELRLWSDSCGGQNRSIKLVLLLMHTLLNHPSLEKITLRFLLSGHSFLPNDAEFGDVEAALKTIERIYTDDDYIHVMETCRRKNKFIVQRFKKEHFVSVDNLIKATTNRKMDLNKNKVSWLSCHEIRLNKSEPTILLMKSNINEEEAQKVSIEKAGKGRRPTLREVEVPCLWPNGKMLSAEKVKDLKEIMKLVPKDAKDFYKFLSAAVSGEFEDDVDGFGSSIDFELEENGETNEPSNEPENIQQDLDENYTKE